MTEHPQLERDQGRVESLLKEVIIRLDRLEATYRQEMAASDHAHARRQEMIALRQEMTALSQHLDRRLDAQLRWIIGIIVGVATLQVAVVSILLKVLT